MPTNQLPRDILIKILLYLPSDSIKACKLVSKEWNNLITDDPRLRLEYPSFAPFLFQNSVYCVSTKITTDPAKIISRCNPPLWVNDVPIEWKDDDEVITQLLTESSKGIACVVTNHRRVLFYNLFNEASYLPTEVPGNGFLYGFGYDRYADDCKMVSVEKGSSLFWVYSLRNRAWKSFEGFPYTTIYYPIKWDQYRCCSFNGVLHWVVAKICQNGFFEKHVILTYDLHTCRFGEILSPSDCSGYDTKVVAELGGRLCYCSRICRYSNYWDQFLTVWTMREYGVSESWTRFLSIDLKKLSSGHFQDKIELTRVVYKCQSGRKLLFVCKRYGTLYWYNIDNDKVTSIQKNTWEKKLNRKRKRQVFEGMQQHIWLDR